MSSGAGRASKVIGGAFHELIRAEVCFELLAAKFNVGAGVFVLGEERHVGGHKLSRPSLSMTSGSLPSHPSSDRRRFSLFGNRDRRSREASRVPDRHLEQIRQDGKGLLIPARRHPLTHRIFSDRVMPAGQGSWDADIY